MILKSTQDIKNAILTNCGELADGTSTYEQQVLDYINEVYQGLLSGSTVYNMDCSEPWTWAREKYPVNLKLEPPFDAEVTLTNGSRNGTYSSAPTISHKDWFLKTDISYEYYRIRSHSASSTSLVLDQPWIGESGTYNVRSVKLDYTLTDDTVIIDDTNRYLDFSEPTGGNVTAVVATGVYSPTTFAAALKTAMETVSPGSRTYTITFNEITRKFTVAQGGASPLLRLLFVTGSNNYRSLAKVLGLSVKDYTTAASYDSEISLNSIQRIVAPMVIYQNRNSFLLAPEDSGKIYALDPSTLRKRYPLTQLQQIVPEKYAEIEQDENGIVTVQFSSYPMDATRVEVTVIHQRTELQNNSISAPDIPIQYRDFIVFGATYRLLLDKSDNKAETFLGLARSKLQSMINSERKDVNINSNDYGRVVPRRNAISYRRLIR